MNKVLFLGAALLALFAAGCATESHRTVETPTVATYGTGYSGAKSTLVVGRFANSSPYMRGIFTDGEDRLGNQAKTILKTHLSQTNRFVLVDRANLEQLEQESALRKDTTDFAGAEVLLTGEVTEFGRKTTGDRQLFGIFGRGKQQTAYSKVSLNVVDVRSSRIIFSVQGAGEYSLSNREVLGTGGTAGYDSTLNGKVLNLSITDAVNKLVAALEAGEWSAATGSQ